MSPCYGAIKVTPGCPVNKGSLGRWQQILVSTAIPGKRDPLQVIDIVLEKNGCVLRIKIIN
jgi:hypothetical protein